MRIIIASAFIFVAGCCGIGAGPSKQPVERWLNSAKGTPVNDIDRVLREYGFSVYYDDHAMRARKSTGCILIEDGMAVRIRLDDSDRIIHSDVIEFRISP